MRNYLNKEQRDIFIKMLAVVGTLDEEMKGWKSVGILTSTEEKYRKMAVTFFYKVADSVISKFGEEFKKQLVRDAKCTEVFTLPKSEADIKKKKYEEEWQNEMVQIDLNALYEISHKALFWCNGDCNKDFKKCELYNSFMILNIPPAVLSTEMCPYRQNK